MYAFFQPVFVMQRIYLIFKGQFKRCKLRCQGSVRTIWSNKGLILVQIKYMDHIEQLSLFETVFIQSDKNILT
jgi:hypothetical protein